MLFKVPIGMSRFGCGTVTLPFFVGCLNCLGLPTLFQLRGILGSCHDPDSNAGGLLDLWATEEQSGVPSTGVYVWSRSPQELLKKIPQLNELNGRWALAGTAAANLYAPTLTTSPDPIIWIESRFSSRQAATALGGEIVDKGANLQILQSKNDLVFENASLWVPTNAVADLATQNLRIISRPRAYIETINAAGRGPEVGQNLRQRISSNGVS
jgi:hypothetical protein